MARRMAPRTSAAGVNADARAAIQNARKGKCKIAFRHLKDASPHHQVSENKPRQWEKAVRDYQLATLIYDKLCTSGSAKGKQLYGARRRRKTVRRRRR
jgi:hypothetical protein